MRSLALLAALVLTVFGRGAGAQEVVVLAGIDAAIDWLEAEGWWGEQSRAERPGVPRLMLTGINPQWRETAQALTVAEKKEIFYCFMLPLVMHANELVRERRSRLVDMRERLADGEALAPAARDDLITAAVLLRAATLDEAAGFSDRGAELIEIVDELLYKLDEIPAGLALGQAAYESGYGTSRFVIEGNAFFGQWSYGGLGLIPEQQRESLGDHRIAVYDWPFDSVRGYFLNLSSHPAYEEFRRLRAELRAQGRPLDSLALADGLLAYSERGQAYVDELKGIIRGNGLDRADGAELRDEPIRFVVGAPDEATAAELRAEIDSMRASGQLSQIVERMRLE